MSFFSRYREVIVCILALAIPFFLLRANLKDPGEMNSVDRVLVTLSTPVQWAMSAVVDSVGDTVTRYTFLVGVREEKERLKFEVQRLKAELAGFVEIEQEVRRLRLLLGFKESFRGNLLAARVVGRGTSEQFRVVRLVIETQDDTQIEKGMPVVTFEGLVGQVKRVAGSYADVLLTVDRKSLVPVVIQRNGAQGILRGLGEADRYSCDVEYLLRTDEVREGDQLFTSGAGGKFPEGILVGNIVSVQRENLGLFQKVIVEPAVRFSRLKEVFVVTGYEGDEKDADAATRRP
ncbi:MAG: rod shape-determining protein MreC [Myxococcota bacterium]|jgi:rod shape-determining protein MreC|nr:rod shape-determining protein MreC [Myxococcota bacterium]